MAGSFAHLHVHTEYSMLDGASRVEELVAAAAADGQPAVGITDHGNMYGVLPFYKACKANGVTPVVGTEAYMAHDDRFERINVRGKVDDTGGEGDGGKKAYYHLTLLAEDNEGYKNLIQLSSRAFMEGYYRKPKVDWDLLGEHSRGIIATTGCLGGHVLQSLLADRFDEALAKAGRLQEIFGRDNLFVELQDHGIPEQARTNPQLVEIAKRIGAPLLATNDSHYTRPEDAESHDALLCVQTGALISQPDSERFKFKGHGHYLKSATEMRHLFAEVESACDNSLWIAERAKVEIEFGKPKLPRFPVPDGFVDDGAYLQQLTMEGARERWGDQLPDTVVERLAYELKVIEDMGFSAYFLIVWDLIRHARDHDIRVGPGRGSAAGCAVAYCLRITDLDPIKYDLLFERFLNPSRISMPDIDMDFDSRYRDEMIRYAAQVYGRDHVAQIVTFGTIKARQAVQDAARVLGYDFQTGLRVSKAMPPLVMGRDTPLYACLEKHEKYEDGYKMAGELRGMYDADPDVKRIVDVAKGLEGMRRSDGIHAAAVVITRDPLTEYLPIQRKPSPNQSPEEAPVVTQYEMGGVEELGLLKMDFLGLRNLDVITDALEMIKEFRGDEVDIDDVPLDDDKTLELLRRGDSIGVFQLEGGPMRSLMRSLAPTSFEDVAALVALYRPGPMAANMHNDYADRKNNRKPVEYFHNDAEELLADTYGLMIYQESVMRVAQKFAGYSLAEADNLRKACLPKGTRILTRKRGYVPIEEVMRLADRRVQTIDTTSATSHHEEVDDVWSVGAKPVYRLTTYSGYEIMATEDHPFLVEDRWTPLRDMKPDDLVAVASHIHTDGGRQLSWPEVELAALLISEGYTPDVTVRRRNPHFCNTDPELLATYLQAYGDRFGPEPPTSYEYAGVTRYMLRPEELLELRPILGTLGLAGDKTIPERLVNASAAKVERFIGLYFCADGWADATGVHIGSKSKAVCLALKRMLLRFGIVSALYSREIEGYGTHWRVAVCDKGQAKDFARIVEPHLTTIKYMKVQTWLAEWGDRRSATTIGIPASLLRSEIERRKRVTGRSKRSLGIDTNGYEGCRILHRSTLDGLIYSERLEDLRTGDLVWDSVRTIEYVGEVECFDFQMANPDRPYAVVEDFLVHNCGKKSRALMAKERATFESGCENTGYGAALGTKLFNIIEQFADYAFNKSHSYGYGLIAYQTAYLKAHYPVEYFAALLTSVKGSLEKAAVYLAECRAMGIRVLVPDVNRSASDFIAARLEDGEEVIPFGLSAVRNVGEGLVELLLAERNDGGPFRDFYEFCDRVDLQVLNKRTVESLIKAGAFDSMGHPRKGLLAVFEGIIDKTSARRREHDMGVMTLFGETTAGGVAYDDRSEIPDLEFDKRDRLAFEKEMLGLYVSDHPLMGAEAALRRKTDGSLADAAEVEEGAIKSFGGVITSLNRKWTRAGDLMAVFALEDLHAQMEVMVFPKTMSIIGHKLADDAVVVVKGRLDKREDQPKLIAMDVEVFDGITDGAPPVRIKLPEAVPDHLVTRLRALISEHPGESQVFLHVGKQVIKLPDKDCVDAASGFLGEVRVLLGGGCLL